MLKRETEKILIIDDSTEHIKILINLLENEYDVFFAKNGREGLNILQSVAPDLILLDIVMPGMNGFEVCRTVKASKEFSEIPIIFISVHGKANDETKGLELGAIDYITKPFNPAIVKARIRNHLKLRSAMKELERLYSLALDANPMTGLPGNNSIAEHVEQSLQTNEAYSVLYTDLDNFKAFNDKYGFAHGDEVILFTADILHQALALQEKPNGFIGHVGGDDFVMIIPTEYTDKTTKLIVDNFEKGIVGFYCEEDRKRKAILSVNRRGEPRTYPIMTISIAVVDLSNTRFSTYIEVNDACVEMKKRAKTFTGSAICFDRRREEDS
ncbi:diguanylate cyclase response regulator [Desulfomarina profundi]|uniref:Diguanylate cyclase response regulator n=1 Tax=Desulfomarina profundi TaxID=2772557 RepID=A0A8D5FP91_9BACT|nr:response regulator [Desulfomarina profundi]BCL61874.1 diguanylate cyclase response regulator [Desulfomarina profundi]